MRWRNVRGLVVVIALLISACGSDAGFTDPTTSTASSATTIDGENALISVVDSITLMCEALDLLRDEGLTPGQAYGVLHDTNLSDAEGNEISPSEIAEFGDLIVHAVQSECPGLTNYGYDVLYWIF